MVRMKSRFHKSKDARDRDSISPKEIKGVWSEWHGRKP
jgi:hypothetical protein